jgi:hypothetical protein
MRRYVSAPLIVFAVLACIVAAWEAINGHMVEHGA